MIGRCRIDQTLTLIQCQIDTDSRFDWSYESFWGAQVALPESADDDDFWTRDQPDDRHDDVHSTLSDNKAYLIANLQQDSDFTDCVLQERDDQPLPQAAAPSDDSIEVLKAPDI